MISKTHLLVVVGARPQFIKAAALFRALEMDDFWHASLVHTGQHHDQSLSKQFFDKLNLPEPHVRLQPRSETRELRIGDMMLGIRQAIQDQRPHWVLVFGDTDSTLAGAWASVAEQVPLIHVEAGLRSGDWSMPEEVNRVLTDRLSSVLVCPTDAALDHLNKEGIVHSEDPHPHPTSPKILRTGDVMHDNAVHFGRSWPEQNRGKGSVLLTMHRPGNVDDGGRLRLWLEAIGTWLKSNDLSCRFPVHPRTKNMLESTWENLRAHLEAFRILVEEPLGYTELLEAVAQAPLVLTDSGGVQKESYSLGTRCVVLRNTTEWVEQVAKGHSMLAGEPQSLPKTCNVMMEQGRFLTDQLYGAGKSAEEILVFLKKVTLARHG